MAPRRDIHTVDPIAAAALLASPRIAVVGASDDKNNFGRTIYCALRDHGTKTFAVHPTAASVDGDPCYPTLSDLPGPVDVAIVMVGGSASAEVVRQCAQVGIQKVWLFKGLGGGGAATEEAIEVAEELGLEVVPGACPMMFLEPVGWFHRLHKAARTRNHTLVPLG
jgi:predicted CoA-binding protein